MPVRGLTDAVAALVEIEPAVTRVCQSISPIDGATILLWLAILLVVAWVLGFAVFKVAGGLIHLLLILAVVVFVYQLVTGRRAV